MHNNFVKYDYSTTIILLDIIHHECMHSHYGSCALNNILLLMNWLYTVLTTPLVIQHVSYINM